ncbi:TRAP transporter solute receptor, TAXI family protein, partial [Vibrio parahaemolyticus V-223/04]
AAVQVRYKMALSMA